MISFTHKNESVIINGTLVLSLDEFRILEPNYCMPVGYTNRYYVPGKTHVVTSPSGHSLSLSTTWQDGDRYIRRYKDFSKLKSLINMEESKIEEEVNKEKFNLLDYKEKRRSEYPKIEDLVVALWESKVLECGFQSHAFSEIEKKRREVKSKYPKG